jgi:hypothetical protein
MSGSGDFFDDDRFVRRIDDDARGEPMSGMAQLERRERAWFASVCHLHELNDRLGTPDSAAVLRVAQRRWAAARLALARANDPAQASNDAESNEPDSRSPTRSGSWIPT